MGKKKKKEEFWVLLGSTSSDTSKASPPVGYELGSTADPGTPLGPASRDRTRLLSQTRNGAADLYSQGFSRKDGNRHTILPGFGDFFTLQLLVLRLHHLLGASQIYPQLEAVGRLLGARHLGLQNASARGHPLQTADQQEGNGTQPLTSLRGEGQ